MMYLRVKDMTPRKYESIYEIAYLLTGRVSIFIVCGIQLAMTFSSMIMYYMIIGDTLANLWAQAVIPGTRARSNEEIKEDLLEQPWWAQILAARAFSIIVVGAVALYFVFKKRLEEMKDLSYVFLIVVGLFVALLMVELSRGAKETTTEELLSVKTGNNLLTAFSILIFSYSY